MPIVQARASTIRHDFERSLQGRPAEPGGELIRRRARRIAQGDTSASATKEERRQAF